jgi:predicted aspartyl protease
MGRFLKSAAIGLLIGMWVIISAAEEIAAKEITPKEISGEQIKEIDEQVQDIKKDVLDISTGFIQLEEKLIYPPNTRLSIFLAVAQGDKFRLDAVEIKIDGKEAAHHIYSSQELEALQHGGVQRIYTGNIRTGEHALEVALIGKSTSQNDYQQNAVYKFIKDAGTKLIEITLGGPGIISHGIVFRD